MALVAALAVALPLDAGERQSSEAMFARAMKQKRKIVEFSSGIPPEEIERRMLDRPCGREVVHTSGITPVGTMFIAVSHSVKFSIDRGFNSVDGSRWLLLRGDGSSNMSSTASAVNLAPRADGGSDVRVFKVDKRKVERIRDSVEAGRLFCDWRSFDYRWD